MPRRELKFPHQVEDWLHELSAQLTGPAALTLIGSGGLLWHAAQRGIDTPLTEQSMDVDPITDSDEIAHVCYASVIGSDFERSHGWHVNLMPELALRELPGDWRIRAAIRIYGTLTVTVPSSADLLVPKLRRNEPRDRQHKAWAESIGLLP